MGLEDEIGPMHGGCGSSEPDGDEFLVERFWGPPVFMSEEFGVILTSESLGGVIALIEVLSAVEQWDFTGQRDWGFDDEAQVGHADDESASFGQDNVDLTADLQSPRPDEVFEDILSQDQVDRVRWEMVGERAGLEIEEQIMFNAAVGLDIDPSWPVIEPGPKIDLERIRQRLGETLGMKDIVHDRGGANFGGK